jgi:hypothetical protein
MTITTDLPVFGPTTVDVEQEPTDPLTYQFGGRLSLDRRWDVMAEVGTTSMMPACWFSPAPFVFERIHPAGFPTSAHLSGDAGNDRQ